MDQLDFKTLCHDPILCQVEIKRRTESEKELNLLLFPKYPGQLGSGTRLFAGMIGTGPFFSAEEPKMRCEACSKTFHKDEMTEYLGRDICEDCYMDALSPARTCDPWAVFNAKSFGGEEGRSHTVSETQAKILDFLEKSGGAEPAVIAESLKISLPDLQRELAALRHMEKIRGELKEGKRRFRIWQHPPRS